MSEQDFFFDEEEDVKPSPKKGQAAAEQPATRQSAPKARPFFEQSISMSIAALMAVIALLVGVIVGVLIPTGGSSGVPNASSATTGASSGTAPQLTQDQINSGELPAGHPDLSGMTGSGTATGSATTTGN